MTTPPINELFAVAETLRSAMIEVAAGCPETGNCFSVAASGVVAIPTPEGFTLELIHGNPTGSGRIEGIEFAHAWIELSDESGMMVIDFSNGRDAIAPAPLYYRHGKITETVRYGREEAIREMVKSGHYGPWDEYTNSLA